MTKEQVLKSILNHSSEIKTALVATEYHLLSLTRGFREQTDGEINSLKGTVDFIKTKADEIKDILNQWPE